MLLWWHKDDSLLLDKINHFSTTLVKKKSHLTRNLLNLLMCACVCPYYITANSRIGNGPFWTLFALTYAT